jgi:hypothetical protein
VVGAEPVMRELTAKAHASRKRKRGAKRGVSRASR